jgi:hypothetical protein
MMVPTACWRESRPRKAVLARAALASDRITCRCLTVVVLPLSISRTVICACGCLVLR